MGRGRGDDRLVGRGRGAGRLGAHRSSGGKGGGEGGGGGDVSCPSSWGIPSSSPSLTLLLHVLGVHAVGGSEAAGGSGVLGYCCLPGRQDDDGTGAREGGGARDL